MPPGKAFALWEGAGAFHMRPDHAAPSKHLGWAAQQPPEAASVIPPVPIGIAVPAISIILPANPLA